MTSTVTVVELLCDSYIDALIDRFLVRADEYCIGQSQPHGKFDDELAPQRVATGCC